MKAFEFISDVISQDTLSVVDDVFDSSEKSFSELVKVAGLNPRYDFRFADLSGIDFSYADLGAYDFTGADLRWSFGVGVVPPAVSSLKEADTGQSIFAYLLFKETLAKKVVNPYSRNVIDDTDPIEGSSWIHRKTGLGSPDRDRAMLAVFSHFETSRSPTILADAIYAAKSYFDDTEDYFNFLVGAIATKQSSSGAIIAALKMLVASFRRREYVKTTLTSFLMNDDRPEVQAQCIQSLGRIKLSKEERLNINSVVLEPKMAMLRRYMMAKLVTQDASRFGFLSFGRGVGSGSHEKPSFDHIFDPAEPITLDVLDRFYSHQASQTISRVSVQYQKEAIEEVGGHAFQKSILSQLFDEMRAAHSATGLTFIFSPDVARFIGFKSMPEEQ